jgi:hypothetical protein
VKAITIGIRTLWIILLGLRTANTAHGHALAPNACTQARSLLHAHWWVASGRGALVGALRASPRHGAPAATLKPTTLDGIHGGQGDSNSQRRHGNLQRLEENKREVSRSLN